MKRLTNARAYRYACEELDARQAIADALALDEFEREYNEATRAQTRIARKAVDYR